ncbi:hypothetical protein AMECASPLE_025499 [Ameca splendens]|uniref:Secreted protein n=1 Tax=Ameca splendens TaxID=208324 RepID=A0ABV0Y4S1_9TELE
MSTLPATCSSLIISTGLLSVGQHNQTSSSHESPESDPLWKLLFSVRSERLTEGPAALTSSIFPLHSSIEETM